MGPALQQGLLAVATTRRQRRWSTRAAAALEDAGGGSEAGDGPGTAAGATGRGDQKTAAALEDTDSARARRGCRHVCNEEDGDGEERW